MNASRRGQGSGQSKPKASGHIPKRGRPSAARVDAIDRAIIEVAREQFFADGFDAVAMEQVAALARVSKGTLYARHPSKEDLFKAVLGAMIADWSRAASKQDDLLSDAIEQRLRHHARTIAAAMQQPDVQAVHRLMTGLGGRFPDLANAFYQSGFLYIVNLIERDLEDWAGREGRSLRDPGSVARTLVSSIYGFQLQLQGLDHPQESLTAFSERLVDLIMAAQAAW